MEITGYRLASTAANAASRRSPTVEEAGETLLRIHKPNDNRWLRFFFLMVFLAAGMGLSFIWIDKLERSGLEFLILLGLYCGLCVYIDERLIKPRTQTFARIPFTLTNSCFHWNEGMEIGRLYYSEIYSWEQFVYPAKALDGGAEVPEQILIMIEDANGQRICFHNAAKSDLDILAEKIGSKSSIQRREHVIE